MCSAPDYPIMLHFFPETFVRFRYTVHTIFLLELLLKSFFQHFFQASLPSAIDDFGLLSELQQQPQTLSVTRDEGVVDLLHFQYLHKEILIRHKQIVARCASILNEQERKKYLTKITFQISFSLWADLFQLFSRLLNKYRLETDFTWCIKCNELWKRETILADFGE